MTKTLKIASAQCRTLDTTADTLNQLEAKVKEAASAGVDLILFPEAYFGGYPRGATFGVTSGGHDPRGYEQYLKYYPGAVDLGDTPQGADEDWVHRRLPVGSRRWHTRRIGKNRSRKRSIHRHWSYRKIRWDSLLFSCLRSSNGRNCCQTTQGHANGERAAGLGTGPPTHAACSRYHY
jgi:hypothetical protein